VIKADGLAAGKGVIVAMSLTEAEAAVRDMLSGNAFGDAGARVVIEEFLDGEEASFIVDGGRRACAADGHQPGPQARRRRRHRPEHRRHGRLLAGPGGDAGGACTRDARGHEPTVQGMIADGIPFTGFLYAGLMIDASGAKVIEFNVRFGDPETQPVMLRLQSDLVELVEAAIDGRLDQVEAQWDARPSLGVVLAARPYPEAPITGDVISGLDDVPASAKVFHAGTALDAQGQVVSAGGRVLCVAALGDSVRDAQANAYAGVAKVTWANEFHRNDIGWRAIAREGVRHTPLPCMARIEYHGKAKARHCRAFALNCFETLPINQVQKLQRRPARLLLALFPATDRRNAGVEHTCEHRLAKFQRRAKCTDLGAAVFGHRLQTKRLVHAHAPLVDEAAGVKARRAFMHRIEDRTLCASCSTVFVMANLLQFSADNCPVQLQGSFPRTQMHTAEGHPVPHYC
jgi:hypothetical protein